ncbi:hypothetical protein [Bradyrhizobium sp. SZCCHNR3118]|uniref:hypothetical protein n=1 Tax=Bradyrhizobium sp. SZCCHNR3118 TaxID=3057468 RepID=UPI0029162AF0|nr:hypothetical protein [Bradyrhizobium sp. SZCCHNR3118]
MTTSACDYMDDLNRALGICLDTDDVEEITRAAIVEVNRLKNNQKASSGIYIAWGNEATYNRHKVAIDVQDAVNLRALAREFVKVVDQAMEEHKSTEATYSDPAVVMFVNKLESLVHSNWQLRFEAAYKTCQEKVHGNS